MFDSLDFLYMPSRDAAADVRHFTGGLGARAELDLSGPQRIALYELTRPDAASRLTGRRDF